MSHEIEDFQRDVIERSRERPVLVDFWAAWCGPCRTLGPILEKLEGQAEGSWELAKVDVDHHREVAAQFRVQGIPAVKLFVDGEVVGEFTGALPESQVSRWLEAHLPSTEKAALAEAVALIQGGRRAEARTRLESLVEADSELPSARVLLAQLVVFDEPARAVDLVTGLRADSDFQSLAQDIRAFAAGLGADPAELADKPVREDYLAGIAALRAQDFEQALERLMGVLGRDKSYHDEGARKLCVAIFNYLGREHPLSQQFRRRFQSALN